MAVELSVNVIRAGGRAHIDVGAAGRSLLGIVHRSVHPDFLNGLWSRRGNRFTNRQINGRAALNGKRAQGRRSADAGFIHNSRGCHLARGLAIEHVFGIDAVEEERIARVALAVSPHRLVAQTSVRSSSGGELLVHPGRQQGQARERTRREGNRVDFGLVHHVAVRGVHGVDQRRFNDADRVRHFADIQSGVHGSRAIGLDLNRRNAQRLKTRVGDRHRVSADRQIYEVVGTNVRCLDRARELGLVARDCDRRARNDRARMVDDRAGDTTKSLLSMRPKRQNEEEANEWNYPVTP